MPISKKSQESFLVENNKVVTGYVVKKVKICFFIFFTIFWNLIFNFSIFSTLPPHNFFVSTRIEKNSEIKLVYYVICNIMASRKVENSPWLTFYKFFSEKVTKISVDFFLDKNSKKQKNTFCALAQGTSVPNFSEMWRAVWPQLSLGELLERFLYTIYSPLTAKAWSSRHKPSPLLVAIISSSVRLSAAQPNNYKPGAFGAGLGPTSSPRYTRLFFFLL